MFDFNITFELYDFVVSISPNFGACLFIVLVLDSPDAFLELDEKKLDGERNGYASPLPRLEVYHLSSVSFGNYLLYSIRK